MIDQDAYKQFTDELTEFCRSRGFTISGTCDSEGIYGEITVHSDADLQEQSEHYLKYWPANEFNFYWEGKYA